MTCSYKRGNNNGAVREESFTITRHCCWIFLRDAQTYRGTNLSLSLSHNLVINCISLLSTAQASITRFTMTFWNSTGRRQLKNMRFSCVYGKEEI